MANPLLTLEETPHNRSFDADTQLHCAAKRAREHTPASPCRCVPINSAVMPQQSQWLANYTP